MPVNCYSRRGCFYARREESRARAAMLKNTNKKSQESERKRERERERGGRERERVEKQKLNEYIHLYVLLFLFQFFCSLPARVSSCSMPRRLSAHANSVDRFFLAFLFVQLTIHYTNLHCLPSDGRRRTETCMPRALAFSVDADVA